MAGEVVECTITFRSPSAPISAQCQWNEQEEILGLATVQIYCKCRLNQSKFRVFQETKLSEEEKAVSSKVTSFAPLLTSSNSVEHVIATHVNRVISSTKPTILFCDLRLLPGESKTCELYDACIYHKCSEQSRHFKDS